MVEKESLKIFKKDLKWFYDIIPKDKIPNAKIPGIWISMPNIYMPNIYIKLCPIYIYIYKYLAFSNCWSSNCLYEGPAAGQVPFSKAS